MNLGQQESHPGTTDAQESTGGADLARAVAGRAAWVQRALSPWVQRALQRVAEGPYDRHARMALTSSHMPFFSGRAQLKMGQGNVWQPDAGSLDPALVQRFADSIVARYPETEGRQEVRPLQIGSDDPLDLVLAGSPAEPDAEPQQGSPGFRPFSSLEAFKEAIQARPRTPPSAPRQQAPPPQPRPELQRTTISGPYEVSRPSRSLPPGERHHSRVEEVSPGRSEEPTSAPQRMERPVEGGDTGQEETGASEPTADSPATTARQEPTGAPPPVVQRRPRGQVLSPSVPPRPRLPADAGGQAREQIPLPPASPLVSDPEGELEPPGGMASPDEQRTLARPSEDTGLEPILDIPAPAQPESRPGEAERVPPEAGPFPEPPQPHVQAVSGDVQRRPVSPMERHAPVSRPESLEVGVPAEPRRPPERLHAEGVQRHPEQDLGEAAERAETEPSRPGQDLPTPPQTWPHAEMRTARASPSHLAEPLPSPSRAPADDVQRRPEQDSPPQQGADLSPAETVRELPASPGPATQPPLEAKELEPHPPARPPIPPIQTAVEDAGRRREQDLTAQQVAEVQRHTQARHRPIPPEPPAQPPQGVDGMEIIRSAEPGAPPVQALVEDAQRETGEALPGPRQPAARSTEPERAEDSQPVFPEPESETPASPRGGRPTESLAATTQLSAEDTDQEPGLALRMPVPRPSERVTSLQQLQRTPDLTSARTGSPEVERLERVQPAEEPVQATPGDQGRVDRLPSRLASPAGPVGESPLQRSVNGPTSLDDRGPVVQRVGRDRPATEELALPERPVEAPEQHTESAAALPGSPAELTLPVLPRLSTAGPRRESPQGPIGRPEPEERLDGMRGAERPLQETGVRTPGDVQRRAEPKAPVGRQDELRTGPPLQSISSDSEQSAPVGPLAHMAILPQAQSPSRFVQQMAGDTSADMPTHGRAGPYVPTRPSRTPREPVLRRKGQGPTGPWSGTSAQQGVDGEMPLSPQRALVTAESIQRRPQGEASESVPTPAESGYVGVIQRVTVGPEESAEPESGQGELNLDRLARQVYPMIRRMLAIERERRSGRWR